MAKTVPNDDIEKDGIGRYTEGDPILPGWVTAVVYEPYLHALQRAAGQTGYQNIYKVLEALTAPDVASITITKKDQVIM